MQNDLQPSSVVLMSVLALVAGLALIYAIYRVGRSVERDKFHRRNAAGVEEFDTFEDATKAQWKSNAATQFSKLFGTLAILLIIGGGIGIAVGSNLEAPRRSVNVAFASLETLTCSDIAKAAISESQGKEVQLQLREVTNEQEVARSATQIDCQARAIWADGASTSLNLRMLKKPDGENRVVWSDGPIPQM